MTDTTVKYFHSAMTGAPTLNGTAGSLIAVLDACLVNGFGLGTLDSLVIAGGVATATRAAGHSQEVGSVALIAGATVTGGSINGEQKVTGSTATTFTFATALANQTATGTITAKLAPATWAKTYSGTNKAAYKPTDVTASGCMLRVDDSATQDARVVGYESMTDVDTGTGPFPTSSQVSGGNFWTKSSAANSTANAWMLFADGRTVYFARAYRSGAGSAPSDYEVTVFGDLIPARSGDAYACVISGAATSQAASVISGSHNLWAGQAASAGMYVPRSYTGLGSALQAVKNYPTPFYNLTATLVSGGTSNVVPFPNPADGGLYVVPHYIAELTGAIYRGQSPGFYCVPQSILSGAFAPRDTVTGVTGLSGRALKTVTVQSGVVATCFFDITGPWR
jgi:hypothetical protein